MPSIASSSIDEHHLLTFNNKKWLIKDQSESRICMASSSSALLTRLPGISLKVKKTKTKSIKNTCSKKKSNNSTKKAQTMSDLHEDSPKMKRSFTEEQKDDVYENEFASPSSSSNNFLASSSSFLQETDSLASSNGK
jgi:hypothetical protein